MFEQIGMGDFSKFVQCLLSNNMDNDDYDFQFTVAHIRDAIDFSGYVSRVGATRPPPVMSKN
ncbi:MAG TPA: hypothetical protein VFL15_03760, partial [Gammaproteobacteria bacterium]|nr:hypothetical protein [Gammaproteobacteria bacterium]